MLLRAAPLLRAAGYDSDLLATGASEGPLADGLRAAGFRVLHLPFRRNGGFVADLYRLLRRERYEVVHVHTEQAFIYCQLAALLSGVPRRVQSIHSIFLFRGALRTRRAAQRALARLLGVVFVAPSPSAAENEWRRFGNRVVVIPNWVDVDALRPASPAERAAARERLGLPPGAFVVVSLGSCHPVKRHELIVRAMAVLREQVPQAVYVHCGSGELQAEERALSARLGTDDVVVFAGVVRDVTDVLHAADVFIMPSRLEGLGVAAVEAMAAGVPVVAADAPGLRDVVEPDVTGVLVSEPVDATRLAAPLVRLARDEGVRQVMGAAGRRRAERYFSVQAGVPSLLTLYGHPLRRRPRWRLPHQGGAGTSA
jgi:glycosyltransferase involved in cell wall biosynthesis